MLVRDARISVPLDVIQTGRRIKLHMLDPTRDANRLLVDRMGPTSISRLSLQAPVIAIGATMLKRVSEANVLGWDALRPSTDDFFANPMPGNASNLAISSIHLESLQPLSNSFPAIVTMQS